MHNRSLLLEWRQRWNRSLFQFLRRLRRGLRRRPSENSKCLAKNQTIAAEVSRLTHRRHRNLRGAGFPRLLKPAASFPSRLQSYPPTPLPTFVARWKSHPGGPSPAEGALPAPIAVSLISIFMTRATNGGLSGVATWTDSPGVSLHDPGYTDLIDARPERACLATVNGSGLPVLRALPVARAPAGVCASLCMKTSSQSRLVTTGSGADPPRCNGYRAGLRREPPGLVAACRRDNARWYAHGPVTCVKICKPDVPRSSSATSCFSSRIGCGKR
jgi:hypothetical protein